MPKMVSDSFVRPRHCERFDGLSEPLSGLDEISTSLFVHIGLCFNALLSPDKLKGALSQTLDAFPEYSGRLNSAKIENFSAGALFEVTVRSEADGRSYTSSRDWERVNAIFSLKGMSRPGQNDPLLRIRLSLFPASGLSVLFLAVNHGLGDAHSITQFLHAWSFHCGGDWPSQKPPMQYPRGCRRMPRYAKDKTPKNLAELWATDPSPLTCSIDRVAAALVLPRIIWAVVRHRVMEIRIDAAGVREWKKRVTAALPPGAWVSSFELIYSMLFFAKSVADGSGVHKARPVFPVINARGRVSTPTPDYLGNLVVTKRIMLGASDQVASSHDATTAAVANLALQFHEMLRAVLATGDDLLEEARWLNAVQDLGYGARLSFSFIADFVNGAAILMNSWRHFPWFDIDMGCGERASKFIQPSVAICNTWTLLPRERESGDMTIHFAMEKGQADCFLRTIAESNMPFHLVEPFVR